MSKNLWKDTHLFKALEARKSMSEVADDLVTLLKSEKVMPKIAKILNDKSTTPKDFTLHDDQHSFRVAQRMWEIIPDVTRQILSDYELSLLLMSAYLHDIGMSPAFDKVERHRKFLVSHDDKELLSETEIENLQEWVDDDQRTDSFDIKNDIIDDDKTLNYVLAYYIRYKHNDWSGEWIREHLKKEEPIGYGVWTDDLVNLCQSHHYDLKQLEKERYDPKPANSQNVHRRYLAMCLRVADVLENDPERTPKVIMQHRSVRDGSITYWLKDKVFELTRDGNMFKIFARPGRAFLHKAVEETCLLIENELKICYELIRRKPLNQSITLALHGYDWPIEPYVVRDIQPLENAYKYIEGSFKPNTTRILELLGGHQLYGHSKWAFRELVQNAFDAVNVRIAHEVLNRGLEPSKYLKVLGNMYSVNISIEKRNENTWLICEDDGAGMTDRIIEDLFLRSGSPISPEIKKIERESKENGFLLGRTGRFGIGVLSYFMISNKIIVETKRVQDTGYSEKQISSLRFEMNGMHDFGELRECTDYKRVGTRVSLLLKSEIARNIKEWVSKFRAILTDDFQRTPCKIKFSSQFDDLDLGIACGWVKQKEDINRILVKRVLDKLVETVPDKDRLITKNRRLATLSENDKVREAMHNMEQITDFLISEGEIENVGTYRIHFPYFKLKHGNCFFFLWEDENPASSVVKRFKNQSALIHNCLVVELSVKGASVDFNPEVHNVIYGQYEDLMPAYVEIDILHEDGEISVNRKDFYSDVDFSKWRDLIQEKMASIIEQKKSQFDNIYASLNCRVTGYEFASNYWAQNNSLERYEWRKVGDDICEIDVNQAQDIGSPIFRNEKVDKVFTLNIHGLSHRLDYLDHIERNPMFVAVQRKYITPRSYQPRYTTVLPKHDGKSTFRMNRTRLYMVDVSNTWDKVLLFFDRSRNRNRRRIYVNSNHPLSSFYDEEIYLRVLNSFSHMAFPEGIKDKKMFFALLIFLLEFYSRDSWEALYERNSQAMSNIFESLDYDEVNVLVQDRVFTVTAKGWVEREKADYEKLLPTPDSQWTIYETS